MFCVRKSLGRVTVLRNVVVTNAFAQSNTRPEFRLFSSGSDVNTGVGQQNETDAVPSKGGFAKAFEKQSQLTESKNIEQDYTFASLLRNSKLVDLGDPVGKTVIGQIYHVVEDDLYIDFGWKFHCVCSRPTNRSNEYVRGARVRIQINDLELSSRFLGSSTDLTLLEADCKLLGLVSSPLRPTVSVKN